MKKHKLEIEIVKSCWSGTNTPCWLIGFEDKTIMFGEGRGCHTLKEAFDELEEICRRHGHELEDCKWSRRSHYTSTDRPDGIICDRKGQMFFNF